jgi:hypothetical protein
MFVYLFYNKNNIQNMTSQEKIEKFAEITKSMLELYTRKNSDYGDSFEKTHTEYGITAFLVRAQDKINRLRSIDKKRGDIKVKDESIEDTIQDLATYSIMTLIELQNDKIKNDKKQIVQYMSDDQ